MKTIECYRKLLHKQEKWDAFLRQESGLPGPRANLALAQAVVAEGDEALFRRYLTLDAKQHPANTPDEFLTMCGVMGLGKLLAAGDLTVLDTLRQYATDPRWRIREAVALALQRWGEQDMAGLIQAMIDWSEGSPLEQRAAAAALCEPRLLAEEAYVWSVLQILDYITGSVAGVANRQSRAFKTLRRGLGYCWSVAVAALPATGKPLMEHWLTANDRDIVWIMRENLGKNRLARMDAAWVEKWRFHMPQCLH